MSTTAAFTDPDKLYKKATHRKNDSGELDVFEAARYFSGGNEAASGCYGTGGAFHQKIMREERQGRRERMSLDVPMRNTVTMQSSSCRVEKHTKEKKHKQPSSPGGRLASFLNALFSQRASKKKKSKSSSQSVKDEEESPGGRRKRRNSISHFHSMSATESKSIYSSSNSGFRTPPPYANTPTKIYKDIEAYSDHKHAVAVPSSRSNGQLRSVAHKEALDGKRNMDLAWLDEKLNLQDNKNFSNRILEKDRIRGDHGNATEEKDFRRFNVVDDGGESDSSSDLFELQNHDLGYYSSGLPVYETTNMESIKRGVAIVNGTL